MIRTGRYSAEEKLDLIQRHQRGETPELGADKFGRDLLAKWEFRAPAGLTEDEALSRLTWTEDDGEIPSLAILREHAGDFPARFLRPGMRVLSLFSARFYGRSDVIHVCGSGAAHATLVDIDSTQIEEMRLIYPPHWSYVASDYTVYLDRVVSGGERFDTVIADTFRFMAEDVAWNRLADIMQLAPLFIVNYFDTMLKDLGVTPTDLPSLSKILSDRAGMPIRVLEIMVRNPEVCWAVISR